MREQYWNFYISLEHKSYYYKYFQIFFNRINWGISCFCTLLSLSCVAAWGIWKDYPVLWSGLICVSQIIQAIFPKLPYNDLLTASKLIVVPLNEIILSVRHSWLQMEYTQDFSDDQICELLRNYESACFDLTSQFFSAAYLPEIKWCETKAEKDCKNYFSITYGI